MTPHMLHGTLLRALNKAQETGFIVWSDMMCHYDSVLMVTLVCFARLGEAYWTGQIDSMRQVSRTERWTLDLLCSLESSTAPQMQHLRNTFMWYVLQDSCTFGQSIDAMIHPFAARDGELDKYHCEKRTVTRRYSTDCTCERHPLESIVGCVRVAHCQRHTDKEWKADNVEACVVHSLLRDSSVNMECRSKVRGTSIDCEGKFRNTLCSVQLGPLLVCAIDVNFQPSWKFQMRIANHEFTLVGLVLWANNHYVCHYRTDIANDSAWWKYDDIAKPNRIRRIHVDDLKNHNSRRAFVRGLWYINTQARGQPVQVDLSALLQQANGK